MTEYQIFDMLAGSSFIFFGGVVAYSAIVLRRLNEGCTKPSGKFYDVFSKASLAIGQVVVVFGAGVAGNSVLGIV